MKLSGGERQRITLARALLKGPKILILDEATSNLDVVTEAAFHKNLQEILKDKTAFIIAHHLSSLLTMDRILMFKKGRILADGNHLTLLKSNIDYQNLWNLHGNLRKSA